MKIPVGKELSNLYLVVSKIFKFQIGAMFLWIPFQAKVSDMTHFFHSPSHSRRTICLSWFFKSQIEKLRLKHIRIENLALIN